MTVKCAPLVYVTADTSLDCSTRTLLIFSYNTNPQYRLGSNVSSIMPPSL